MNGPHSPASIRFTEEMKGYAAFGENDFERGEREGRTSHMRLMFHLTIEIDDLDHFAADPERAATANGWVGCDDLGALCWSSGASSTCSSTSRTPS